MEKTNGLSRRPNWKAGVKRDNKDRKLLKLEQFEVRVVEKGEIMIKNVDLLEKIRKLKAKKNKVIKVVDKMKQANVKMLRNKK